MEGITVITIKTLQIMPAPQGNDELHHVVNEWRTVNEKGAVVHDGVEVMSVIMYALVDVTCTADGIEDTYQEIVPITSVYSGDQCMYHSALAWVNADDSEYTVYTYPVSVFKLHRHMRFCIKGKGGCSRECDDDISSTTHHCSECVSSQEERILERKRELKAHTRKTRVAKGAGNGK